MLRNITWLAATSAVVKPAWFLFITAVCMRFLGAERYGVLSAALALSFLVMAVTDLGTAEYALREVARERARAIHFFSNFLFVRGVASAGAYAALIALAVLIGYDGTGRSAVAFAGLYVGALGLVMYCRSFFEAFQDLKADAISIAIEKVLVIALGSALLIATRSPAWTLAGMALGMALAFGANALWVTRRFAPFSLGAIDRTFIRTHLRSSIPFGIAGLLSIAYYRIDLVMIESMRNATEAGQYAAAFRILEALNLLPFVVVQAAMYPRFAALFHERRYVAFSELMRRGTVSLLLISTAVAAALTVWGPALITLLDPDPAYRPAGLALQILCWTFPLTCLNAVLYVALLAVNEQRYRAQVLAAAVVFNIALNLVLIPRHGIIGAASATIASEVLVVAGYAWRYRLKTGPTRPAPAAAGDARR